MHIKGVPATGVLLVHDADTLFIIFKSDSAAFSGFAIENTPGGKWHNVTHISVETTRIYRWFGREWRKVPKSELNREFVQDCRDVHKGAGALKIDHTNSSAPMFAATKKLTKSQQHYVTLATTQYREFRAKAKKLRSLTRKMTHLYIADGSLAPTWVPLVATISPVADKLLDELAKINPTLVQTPEIYTIFQARMAELQAMRKSVLGAINTATTTTRDYCNAA